MTSKPRTMTDAVPEADAAAAGAAGMVGVAAGVLAAVVAGVVAGAVAVVVAGCASPGALKAAPMHMAQADAWAWDRHAGPDGWRTPDPPATATGLVLQPKVHLCFSQPGDCPFPTCRRF